MRIHNLPPHLSYISTLPGIIQKLKHNILRKKNQRLTTDRNLPATLFAAELMSDHRVNQPQIRQM